MFDLIFESHGASSVFILYHAIPEQIEYLVWSDDTLLLRLVDHLHLQINKGPFNRGITAMVNMFISGHSLELNICILGPCHAV